MSDERKNYIGPITAALGPERSMAFMEMVAKLGLNGDDPELLLCAAMASFVISISEFQTWAAAERNAYEKANAEFAATINLKVAEAFTRGADDFQTELRLAARETAQSEYRSAASLRSQSIQDEVSALTAAAAELSKRRDELKAQSVVRGPHSQTRGTVTPRLVAVLAAVLIIGWVAGLLYATSVAPVQRHAARLVPTTITSALRRT